MKWTLLAIVLEAVPVETGLTYDDLASCYRAEERMRQEYADWYDQWIQWASKHPDESNYPDSMEVMARKMAYGICVPTS